MFIRLFIGLITLVAAAFTAPTSWAEDVLWVGSWNIKAVDTKWVDLVHYGELHVSDHAPAPLQYQLTGRVTFDPWKSLNFALGYSYLSRQVHDSVLDEWEDTATHRFEVEVNPRWSLGKGIKLSLRNRFEERWVEDKPGTYPRSRHRLELAIPLKKAGPISETFTFVEAFLDWRTGEINQTRVVPLGVTWKFNRLVSLRTYYAWQTFDSSAGHYNEHMLWTQWFVNLK